MPFGDKFCAFVYVVINLIHNIYSSQHMFELSFKKSITVVEMYNKNTYSHCAPGKNKTHM